MFGTRVYRLTDSLTDFGFVLFYNFYIQVFGFLRCFSFVHIYPKVSSYVLLYC